MITEIELVAAVGHLADEAVVEPILIDRAEIRESAGQRTFFQISCALFVTPYDVPLGVGVVRVFERAAIFADVGSGAFCGCAWSGRASTSVGQKYISRQMQSGKEQTLRRQRGASRELSAGTISGGRPIARSRFFIWQSRGAWQVHGGSNPKGRNENQDVRKIHQNVFRQR